VGNPRYKLGTYAPKPFRDETAIAAWRERSVFTIEKCKSCELATVCGGGCGAIAVQKSLGNVLSPDCRPVRELLGLGAGFYGLDE